MRTNENGTTESRVPVVALRGVAKSFPGVRALRGVDLDIFGGEIHALVGENGAGKSTLIKILGGFHRPDAGEILVDAQPVRFPTTKAALQAGIAIVHQEFNYCPELDVVENMYIGRELPRRRGGLVDWPAARRRTREVFEELGVSIDVRVKVWQLTPERRKILEIARALASAARVLILDEPTAALEENDVERLFAVLRGLQAREIGILYVSHRLSEIFAISDRTTVLRDGELVGTELTSRLDSESLVRQMVGRQVDTLFPKSEVALGETVLRVSSLTSPGRFEDVTFSLRRGEILGFAGLVGSGRSAVADALFGIVPVTGSVEIDGKPIELRRPINAIASGIGYVPEDRQRQGLIRTMSVAENLTLPMLPKLKTRLELVDRRLERAHVEEQIEQLRIVCSSRNQRVGRLSGGNQQKVVIGKWLMMRPRVFILDEPTTGVDVGAKAEIHSLMARLVAEGLCIILISSDLPELTALSDRVVVFHEGRITAELIRSEATQERIMQCATNAGASLPTDGEANPE